MFGIKTFLKLPCWDNSTTCWCLNLCSAYMQAGKDILHNKAWGADSEGDNFKHESDFGYFLWIKNFPAVSMGFCNSSSEHTSYCCLLFICTAGNNLLLLTFPNGFAGCETERSGPVCDVSFSHQKPGVDADQNQQLHVSESLLRWDWVHHLHQHQREVCAFQMLTYRVLKELKHCFLVLAV